MWHLHDVVWCLYTWCVLSCVLFCLVKCSYCSQLLNVHSGVTRMLIKLMSSTRCEPSSSQHERDVSITVNNSSIHSVDDADDDDDKYINIAGAIRSHDSLMICNSSWMVCNWRCGSWCRTDVQRDGLAELACMKQDFSQTRPSLGVARE